MNCDDAMRRLRRHMNEVEDLQEIARILHWDQATNLPQGGAEARGRQIARLAVLVHRRMTDPALVGLLGDLHDYETSLAPQHVDAAFLRETRRQVDRANNVPESLVQEINEHRSVSQARWIEARQTGSFDDVRSTVERTLELSRAWADCFPGARSPMDPLIDTHDPGLTVDDIRPIFRDLVEGLVPRVRQWADRPMPAADFLAAPVPEEVQIELCRWVIQRLGFDMTRGRLDISEHPFMIRLGPNDLRLTTRVRSRDFFDTLMSTIHEAGHGLYEQGIDPHYHGTPLGHGASSALHESQSRLWENMIGRSRGFWTHVYPHIQARVPSLAEVSMDHFYRAIHRVAPGLIRIEADEVTYGLHVVIRFDIEVDLLEGRLAVGDLPERWAADYEALLGVRPATDREGVLQDIHWFDGLIGGCFQGYALGNLIAAQLFEAAAEDLGGLEVAFAGGDFEGILGWMRERVHRHGRRYDTADLVRQATGRPLSVSPFLRYLDGRYGVVPAAAAG